MRWLPRGYRRPGGEHRGTELLRLLERHVVRGLLEPDPPLRGRVEPFEVGRGEARVDLAVEATEEEEHRHRDAGHRDVQIEPEQLAVHRLERPVVRADEARNLPGRRVA